MVRALVTGASGFVGRHLLAHLRASGDDVITSSSDITNRKAIMAEFQSSHPEIVYHLAAQADVGASWASPILTLRVNIEGTYNVLEAAHSSGVKRVLVTSSSDVYGQVDPEELPVNETSPMRPVTPYGASKAASEIICLQVGLGLEIEVVRARAFNHLGPGQNKRFVASALAARIVTNEHSGDQAVKVGNLEAQRDFTDVRDVVKAYRMLALSGKPGEAYNVCSGKSHSVQELAEQLLRGARHHMYLETDASLIRPVDVPEVIGNPEKLRASTDWMPEIPLGVTLNDLLEYWRENRNKT